jgi:hypothetical protein
MNTAVSWDAAAYSLADINRRFRHAYTFIIVAITITLMMEYQTTRLNIAEDSNLQKTFRHKILPLPENLNVFLLLYKQSFTIQRLRHPIFK